MLALFVKGRCWGRCGGVGNWGQGSPKWAAAASWHVLSHAARAESTLRNGSEAKTKSFRLPLVARKLPLKLLPWVVAATGSRSCSRSPSRRTAGSLSFERVHDSTRTAAAAGSGLHWKSVVTMVERKTPPRPPATCPCVQRQQQQRPRQRQLWQQLVAQLTASPKLVASVSPSRLYLHISVSASCHVLVAVVAASASPQGRLGVCCESVCLSVCACECVCVWVVRVTALKRACRYR